MTTMERDREENSDSDRGFCLLGILFFVNHLFRLQLGFYR